MDDKKIIIEIVGKNNATQAINQAIQSSKNLKNELGSMKDDWAKVDSSVNKFSISLNQLGAIAATAFSFNTVKEFVSDLLQAYINFEKLSIGYKAVFETSEKANKELDYSQTIAKKLGLNWKTVAEEYRKFSAATQESNITLQNSRNIYLGVAEGASALQLSTEDTSRVIKAFTDMLSKGTVQAEEIKGQLGDVLPGALALAAKSLGITTSEFIKLSEKGEIVSKEMIPKLVMGLHEKYGDSVAAAANSASAKINQLNQTLDNLKARMSQEFGISASFKWLMDQINSGLGPNNAIKGMLEQIEEANSGIRTIINPETGKPEIYNQLDAISDAIKASKAAGDLPQITVIDPDQEKKNLDKVEKDLKNLIERSNPWKEYQARITGLNTLKEAGRIDQNIFNDAAKKAWKEAEAAQESINRVPKEKKAPIALGVKDIDQSLLNFNQRTESVFQKLNDAKADFNTALAESTGDILGAEFQQIQKWADDSKVAFSKQVESAQQAYKEIEQRLGGARGGGTMEAFAELAAAKGNYEALKNAAAEYYDQIDKTADLKKEMRKLEVSTQGAETLAQLNQEYVSLTGTMQQQYEASLSLLDAERDRLLIGKSQAEQAAIIANYAEKIRVAEAHAGGSFWEGMSEGAARMQREIPTAFDQGIEAVNSFKASMDDATDAFIDFVATGEQSFSELITSMLQDIERLLLKQATSGLTDFLVSSATNLFSGLFGSTASAPILPHASGDYWFREPTIAMGLNTGQRHLIAENGPEYLAGPAGKIAQSSPSITINNQTGTPIKAENIKFDGKQWVLNIIAEDYSKGGSIWKMIRSK